MARMSFSIRPARTPSMEYPGRAGLFLGRRQLAGDMTRVVILQDGSRVRGFVDLNNGATTFSPPSDRKTVESDLHQRAAVVYARFCGQG